MPYKIYTYEDPYRLNETDFWEEISSLPHFCSAQTLANGLRKTIRDSIHGVLSTLDALVNDEEVYHNWTQNISLQIQQYSALTKIFNYLYEKGSIDDNFRAALEKNQNYFLEAIRLFIELGIPAESFDKSKGNKEQKLFAYALRKVEKDPLFLFPQTPEKDKLKGIIRNLATKEFEEFKENHGSSEVRNNESWFQHTIDTTDKWSGDAIVVHGVHQFSPAQLKLLIDMDRMGMTIIFLFNYQKKYESIYSSWNEIYSCFEVPFHHDTKVQGYHVDTMQTPSNALACALGELCEGKIALGSPRFKELYQLYCTIPFTEFANITEYAHFVSTHVDAAKQKYSEDRTVMERGNDVWDNSKVLGFLDEQVYTANRDIHTLLNIYYPEYSKERHFLSYPIGQFFSAIYRLWDYEKREIVLDIPAIKECLNSNILQAAPGEVLLRTFCNLQILFESLVSYHDFQTQIKGKYLQNYDRVAKSKPTEPISTLKDISIYNQYKVNRKDIESLLKGIDEINTIATHLFALDESREDFVDFGKHFKKLEEFIAQRESSLANQQEQDLIHALQERLDQIQPDQSAFAGTFRDLKEGLYYYLKQKNTDNGPDWVVKNFEQIDGDILQSKIQFEQHKEKTYHFACLSDMDMNKKINDLLPWPLTEKYIHDAYCPIDLQYQVYYSALAERGNFLRYALFYGLFFNRCKVALSYVRQYGDETTEPFAPFTILGLSPKGGPIEELVNTVGVSISGSKMKPKPITYSKYQMMDMFLCPYRFFLDYVMEDKPIAQGNFLYQKFYENYLIDAAWKEISEKPSKMILKDMFLKNCIDRASKNIEEFFPFWKSSEIADLKRRAQNYLLHKTIGKNKIVPKYQADHMTIRKLFGNARFDMEISDKEPVNPYPAFEGIAQRSFPNKVYSLHKVPDASMKAKADALKQDMLNYLNETFSSDKSAVASDWCTYCVHSDVCMESCLQSNK